MITRSIILLGFLFCVVTVIGANDSVSMQRTQFPSTYIPSGEIIYKQYCSACHGSDGRGGGPVASELKNAPPDLTTLALRHGGKFPFEYVFSVLQFGPGVSAHGSVDMPTWGPIFNFLDKHNERAARQRIKNVTAYLATLQKSVIAERSINPFQTAVARPSSFSSMSMIWSSGL
jgi:mono/diheme cytochrome c family protein